MEIFKHIFAFDSEHPLMFTQFYFWAFFAMVYAIFAIIMDFKPISRSPRRERHVGETPSNSLKEASRNRLHLRNIFLMAVSWFFYYKTSGLFLLILLFVTLSEWLIAKRISKFRSLGVQEFRSTSEPSEPLNSKATRSIKAKLWLTLSIVIDLGLLCYFKYAYFFTNVINNWLGTNIAVFDLFAYIGNGFSNSGCFSVDNIILPVGISFYIFQVMSYSIDVYRGHVQPVKNILDFGFYVSFFPQLVAGPIVRANEFIPQLYRPFRLSHRLAGTAVFWILNGLAKKIILSDFLAANIIDRVFDNPLFFTGFENLIALFAYSLLIYADFSGYTDIAIGLALLMGFNLPQNFDSPYKARTPQEFWRRWHMSLSRWLKSYLYIPLGGNRKILGRNCTNKTAAGNVNSFFTMLIGGLWHGASWNFVIWGALNGAGMVVHKIWTNANWHIRYAFITIIYLALYYANTVHQLPLVRVIHLWMAILWAGATIQYLYGCCDFLIRGIKKIKVARFKAFLTLKTPTIPQFIARLSSAWMIIQTFVFITFTRLFFRAGSNLDPETANQEAWNTATNMINQIGGKWDMSLIPEIICTYRNVLIVFVLGMIIHWLPRRWKRWYRIQFASLPVWMIILLTVIAIFVVYQFMTAEQQEFVYFQF